MRSDSPAAPSSPFPPATASGTRVYRINRMPTTSEFKLDFTIYVPLGISPHEIGLTLQPALQSVAIGALSKR